MLDKTQLRIGNIVVCTEPGRPNICAIQELRLHTFFADMGNAVVVENLSYELNIGLSLNTDIIEKLGFHASDEYVYPRFYYNCRYAVRVYEIEGRSGVYGFYFWAFLRHGWVPIKQITYLHDLQNMYHAFTGEELPVDFDKLIHASHKI